MIEIENLSKRYGNETVVDGIDLGVRPGQCFGLLGPNGAGKTTTIRMLLGLTAPSHGVIRVLGEAIPAQAWKARQKIGVVPQLDNLDPDFSVEENLRVYASYFGLKRDQFEMRLPWLLDFAELAHKRHARIGELSGGMQRRLSIARALVNDPELIVLDEPTTGLDPQVRHVVWSRLRNLQAQGKTLLLTTHYMEEAERLCDELAILDHGRIIAQGGPKALMAQHVEPEVFEFAELSRAQQERLENMDALRCEQSGTSWYVYTREPAILRGWLGGERDLTVLQRPCNLEDVFLRLTRRELRD